MNKKITLGSITGFMIGIAFLILALGGKSNPARIALGITALVWLVCVVVFVFRVILLPARIGHKKDKALIGDSTLEPNSIEDSRLLQHVNYRITDYLHGVFPLATWKWETHDPLAVIRNGGVARIITFGTGEFTHCEIQMDQYARIGIFPMLMTSLEKLQGNSTPLSNPLKPNFNTEAWFDLTGREDINRVAMNLMTQGHSVMYIAEDGNVLITQGEERVPHEALHEMPPRECWPELIALMQKNGMQVAETG